jgi:hypothetical protein
MDLKKEIKLSDLFRRRAKAPKPKPPKSSSPFWKKELSLRRKPQSAELVPVADEDWVREQLALAAAAAAAPPPEPEKKESLLKKELSFKRKPKAPKEPKPKKQKEPKGPKARKAKAAAGAKAPKMMRSAVRVSPRIMRLGTKPPGASSRAYRRRSAHTAASGKAPASIRRPA